MALTPARVVARLLANVEQAGGCVVTLYSVGSHGYGQIGWHENGRRDGPRSSCRLGSRARPHPQRADRRLDGVWGGMTTEQRRPLLGTKPKQVPA